MGAFMTISFIAFLLKSIVLLLYQSEPVRVVPTIVSVKKPLFNRRPIPWDWTVNFREHVVMCGPSSHLRGHILTLRGRLPHHWLATPKHWLHLFVWLLVYLIYRSVQHLPWIIACMLLNCCSVFLFPSSVCNTQKTSYPVFLLNFLLRSFR